MILITGASAGIGEACAKAFAATGKSLILLARREERLHELKSKIEKNGIGVHCFKLDVSDKKAVEEFAQSQSALLSKVEVLVNNAGLAKGLDTIQDGKLSDWESMIDTNVKGLLYVSRMVLPHLIKNQGHVVNLGSVAGHWVYPKGNIYCATKSAVKALNEGMRLDLHGTGVRVTEISPGLVETEFSQVRLEDTQRAKAVYQGLKVLSAEDIAETILWAVNRPPHVNIQEIVLFPTDQASVRDTLRK